LSSSRNGQQDVKKAPAKPPRVGTPKRKRTSFDGPMGRRQTNTRDITYVSRRIG
jgi:hypothetical protein